MLMAQMLKHLDASEPVRFLIAECETAFTLMAALYFAKQFGIEDRIDISPLFETRKALERGASIIADALVRRALAPVSPRPRPLVHPDRVLRRRPLYRPAGGGRRHRAASASSSSSS